MIALVVITTKQPIYAYPLLPWFCTIYSNQVLDRNKQFCMAQLGKSRLGISLSFHKRRRPKTQAKNIIATIIMGAAVITAFYDIRAAFLSATTAKDKR